jgi:hypothetical protein
MLGLVLLADQEGLPAVRCVQDDVPLPPKDVAGNDAQLVFVFDEEDRGAAAFGVSRLRLQRRVGFGNCAADARQVDLEGRPLARFTIDEDVPPLSLTIPKTVARPSPVPLPLSLVEKKGSKIRARVSFFIPHPVSLTASSTYGPG